MKIPSKEVFNGANIEWECCIMSGVLMEVDFLPGTRVGFPVWHHPPPSQYLFIRGIENICFNLN